MELDIEFYSTFRKYMTKTLKKINYYPDFIVKKKTFQRLGTTSKNLSYSECVAAFVKKS